MKDKTARTLDVEDVIGPLRRGAGGRRRHLTIEPGEVVALLGPSGCGKTTLLRVIAGFVRQVSGRVRVDGAPIDHLPANQRNVGIVFQNYALFPHMTVAENVAYGLRARGARGPEVAATVNRFLETVQLAGFRDRLPRQLSGGQQQRVALARALAVEPSILLLDEPFAALDRNLRLDMQIEVKRLQRALGLTTILVTHDQDEAMSVADRIAVMNKGKVEQFDSPVAIYDKPQTLFVNGFIGTSNLLGGKIAAIDNGIATVTLDAGAVLRLPAPTGLAAQSDVLLSIRPEQLTLSAIPGPELWRIEPGLSLPLGGQLVHEARTADGTTLKIAEPRARRAQGPAARLLRPVARRPPVPVPAFHLKETLPMFNRRSLLAGATALGGASLLPGLAHAKGSVTATTYPGTWEDAYRTVVAPLLKKKEDIELELAPLFAMDQVGKAKASRGAPPFDVFVLDPGPRIVAIESGIFDKFDPQEAHRQPREDPRRLRRRMGRRGQRPGGRHRLQPEEAAGAQGLEGPAGRAVGVAAGADRLPDHLRHLVDHRAHQAVRRLADQRRAGPRRAQEGAAQDRRGRPAGRHAGPVPARPVRRDVHQHPDRRDAQGQGHRHRVRQARSRARSRSTPPCTSPRARPRRPTPTSISTW